MFDRTLRSLIKKGMLQVDKEHRLLLLLDRLEGKLLMAMGMSACLCGGVFALAAMSSLSTEGTATQQYLLSMAINLTRTCHEASEAMPTGLGNVCTVLKARCRDDASKFPNQLV